VSSTTAETTTPDGVPLLIRRWPAVGEARAGVLIVHGLGEHSGRYEHVGDHLAVRGLEVRAFDLRGHGRSGGRRAFVDRFEDLVEDARRQLAHLTAAGRPTVVLGHSLGGVVALRLSQAGLGPDLLVLSAPSIEAAIAPWKKIIARLLGRVAPRLSLPNGFTGEQLSRDPTVGEDYFADPLVETRTTTRLGAEALRAMAAARRNLHRLAVPTLVIHSGADSIVPPAVSAHLADHPLVDRVVFPNFRHESFNEDGGTRALDTVASWIGDRVGHAAS
jgi:alpha-beta hydrolase superfamily lysophospholipase